MRTLHQNVQTIGSVFLVLGILFIIANKIEFGISIIPTSIHSILGVTCISLIIVQVVSGNQRLDVSNSKTKRWHGDVGLLLWDLLCLTVLFGFAEFFVFSISHILVELSIFALWVAVYIQMRRKVDDSENKVSKFSYSVVSNNTKNSFDQ